MSARKEIKRPNVSDLAAGLTARFGSTPAVHTPHQDEVLPSHPEGTGVTRESHSKNTSVRQGTRPAPDGMKRRSLYTSTAAFDALDVAVARIQQSTGDLIPKHEILARLLTAAASQGDIVLQQLRDELTKRFQEP